MFNQHREQIMTIVVAHKVHERKIKMCTYPYTYCSVIYLFWSQPRCRKSRNLNCDVIFDVKLEVKATLLSYSLSNLSLLFKNDMCE